MVVSQDSTNYPLLCTSYLNLLLHMRILAHIFLFIIKDYGILYSNISNNNLET